MQCSHWFRVRDADVILNVSHPQLNYTSLQLFISPCVLSASLPLLLWRLLKGFLGNEVCADDMILSLNLPVYSIAQEGSSLDTDDI